MMPPNPLRRLTLVVEVLDPVIEARLVDPHEIAEAIVEIVNQDAEHVADPLRLEFVDAVWGAADLEAVIS